MLFEKTPPIFLFFALLFNKKLTKIFFLITFTYHFEDCV